MEKNRYTDALKNAEDEYIHYSLRILLVFAVRIATLIFMLFLIISFFIHWFSNDTLTFMQVAKWSLSSFWWMYVIIIAQCFIPYRDIRRNYYKFQCKYKTLKKLSEVNDDGSEV